MPDFLANQFGLPYPEPIEIILIGESNGFVFFNIGDADRHRIQNKLKKGLAAAQGFLGFLALANIRHRAGHPGRPAIRVTHRLTLALQPQVLAVFPAHPEFHVEGPVIAQMLDHRPPDA